MSLKAPSAGAPVGMALVAERPECTWTKGFQGLEGQWKGVASEEGEDLARSSSDDSSLVEPLGGLALAGFGAWDSGEGWGEGVTSSSRFLRGDQPGGRRLVRIWR